MKKVLSFLFFLFSSLYMVAQEARLVDTNYGKRVACIDVVPLYEGYSDYRLYLEEKELGKFASTLKSLIDKNKEWMSIAEKNDVKDFRKDFDKKLTFSYVFFKYKEYTLSTVGDYRTFLKVDFIVDGNGDEYVSIYSMFGRQQYKVGPTTHTKTTSDGVSGKLFGSGIDLSSSYSKSKSYETLDLFPSFRIYIPAKEFESYVEKLYSLHSEIKNHKTNNKNNDKLFK